MKKPWRRAQTARRSFLVCTAHLVHDAEEVCSPDLTELAFVISKFEQTARQVQQVVGSGAADDTTTAVEVRPDAHMVDSCNLDAVVYVVDHIDY